MTKKACAKVNIFLKIVGTRGDYHLLSSRFMLVPDLFDTLTLRPKEKPSKTFSLIGDFGCATEKNTIYKAWRALLQHTESRALETLFQSYEIHVEKRIPEFAGLGGGSSDAAAFLHLCNEACDLGLDTPALAEIGATIGADVPFFVYGYPSANVSGIGEIVEPFDEAPLALVTKTPDIRCDTAAVYRAFRETELHRRFDNAREAERFAQMPSAALLELYDTAGLNDLFTPALSLCPGLNASAGEGWFFSGSGSTFFKRSTPDG